MICNIKEYQIGSHQFDKDVSTHVVKTVLWSLYCFLKHPNNFMNAIYETISVGGNIINDTTCIVGAISGAYLGIDVIPKQFMQRLNDYNKFSGEDIYKLAERIYDSKHHIKKLESDKLGLMMDICII